MAIEIRPGLAKLAFNELCTVTIEIHLSMDALLTILVSLNTLFYLVSPLCQW
jgi:hypothetical protein